MAIAARIPAPFELRSASTYARSFAGVLSGPEGGVQMPVLASAVEPAGQIRQRCKFRPALLTVLTTVPAAALEHWQTPAADRLAGCHAVVNVKPLLKLVALPLLESHSTQLSLSADGT